jgi:hypothetical protein
MSHDDCNCGDLTVEQADESTENPDTWIEERPVKTAQLPVDVAGDMSRFFGESIEAFDDMISAIRSVTEGNGISVDELCHVEEETPHYADTEEETFYFRCFYDAIILAALENEPIDVHTVSPDGVVIEAHAVGSEELSVDPETAVFSLGIGLDAHEESGGDPTLQDSYAAICPYIKAFTDRDAYDTWADAVPATTVATPMSGATAFARALTTEGNDEKK